jgi:hypothetical protein
MNGYVSIPVPEVYYRKILDHLLTLMTERQVDSPTPATVTEESAPAQPRRSWSDEQWRRVWRDLRPDTRELLVVIAEQPSEWVPINALVSALGTSREVQSALSSFTKRAKRQGMTWWPFEAVADVESGGRFRYRMDETTANTVRELAQDDQGG